MTNNLCGVNKMEQQLKRLPPTVKLNWKEYQLKELFWTLSDVMSIWLGAVVEICEKMCSDCSMAECFSDCTMDWIVRYVSTNIFLYKKCGIVVIYMETFTCSQ